MDRELTEEEIQKQMIEWNEIQRMWREEEAMKESKRTNEYDESDYPEDICQMISDIVLQRLRLEEYPMLKKECGKYLRKTVWDSSEVLVTQILVEIANHYPVYTKVIQGALSRRGKELTNRKKKKKKDKKEIRGRN